MASTFDNDLRLEEMATGENAGSWGTKTNTNLELIADAFGYGTFTIANADTTLTIPDGSGSDNSLRSLYLKISSSADLTTTRVLTIDPNTVSKLWYIENNTSGGQTITISQGSGANVNILNGQAKLVATDGAGAGAAVIDVTQDLAIPDLFIDDDLSLQSDGAIINFGEDADVTLTHVADTGLRLNDAMALEFRDGDLSINSSADGQLDIDADTEVEIVAPTVDIDASTAMTIDTTTLTVTGNTDLDGDLTVNTNTLYVDSTNNRVGIQNTSPSTPLDVRANLSTVYTGTAQSAEHINIFNTGTGAVGLTSGIRFQTRALDATGQAFFIGSTATSGGQAPNFKFQKQVGPTTYQEVAALNVSEAVFNDPENNYDFRVASADNTNMLFVDANTNRVGINESVPDTTLHVNSGDGNLPLKIESTDAEVYLQFSDSGATSNYVGFNGTTMRFLPNNTERMQLTSDGNIGLSVTPSAWNTLTRSIQLGDTGGNIWSYTSSATSQEFMSMANNSYLDSSSDYIYIRDGGATQYTQQNNQHFFYAAATSTAGATVSFTELVSFDLNEATFNEDATDADFRIKTDNNNVMFFVDGATDSIGVGTATPNATFGVQAIDDAEPVLRLTSSLTAGENVHMRFQARTNSDTNVYADIQFDPDISSGALQFYTDYGYSTADKALQLDAANGAIFNDGSSSTRDFRVESVSEGNMFLIDAGENKAFFGGNSDSYDANRLNIRGPHVVPGTNNGNVAIYSTDNHQADVGGSLTFGGRYTAGGVYYMFGGIQAVKKYGTSGNAAGRMKFYYVNSSNGTIPYHTADESEIQFNPDGNDVDFTIDSDAVSDIFLVDAGNNAVAIKQTRGGNLVNFVPDTGWDDVLTTDGVQCYTGTAFIGGPGSHAVCFFTATWAFGDGQVSIQSDSGYAGQGISLQWVSAGGTSGTLQVKSSANSSANYENAKVRYYRHMI